MFFTGVFDTLQNVCANVFDFLNTAKPVLWHKRGEGAETLAYSLSDVLRMSDLPMNVDGFWKLQFYKVAEQLLNTHSVERATSARGVVYTCEERDGALVCFDTFLVKALDLLGSFREDWGVTEDSAFERLEALSPNEQLAWTSLRTVPASMAEFVSTSRAELEEELEEVADLLMEHMKRRAA